MVTSVLFSLDCSLMLTPSLNLEGLGIHPADLLWSSFSSVFIVMLHFWLHEIQTPLLAFGAAPPRAPLSLTRPPSTLCSSSTILLTTAQRGRVQTFPFLGFHLIFSGIWSPHPSIYWNSTHPRNTSSDVYVLSSSLPLSLPSFLPSTNLKACQILFWVPGVCWWTEETNSSSQGV